MQMSGAGGVAKRGAKKKTPGMSRSAYVAHRKARGLPGSTYKAVKNAIDAGRISVDEWGKIPDAAAADVEWEQNSRARTAVDVVDYQTARTHREHYNAELARLQLEEREGSLIDAAKAHSDGFAIGRALRDKLLAIPARVSPIFASLEDPVEIGEHLEREIRAALESLAGANEDDSE